MSVLEDFFDICIKMPNMGSFIFYVIFILCIPIVLLQTGKHHLLKLFLPLLVPVSIILTQAGKPNKFRELYPLEYENISGFVSKIIINLVALASILWFSSQEGVARNSSVYGTAHAISSIIIIFFLSTELIPLVIRRGDKYLKENFDKENFIYEWHKYLLGILVLIVLVVLEVGVKEVLIDML